MATSDGPAACAPGGSWPPCVATWAASEGSPVTTRRAWLWWILVMAPVVPKQVSTVGSSPPGTQGPFPPWPDSAT